MGNWTLQHLNKNVLIKMLEEKENNWNELKEWLEERAKNNYEFYFNRLLIASVIDKMECIEKGIEQEQVELKIEKVGNNEKNNR